MMTKSVKKKIEGKKKQKPGSG